MAERKAVQDDMRFRILRLLEQNPEMSQRDLARSVGISTGSTHYVLKALIDKGLVKLSNFSSSKDRRRYAYVLTPSGIAARVALTQQFLARKMAEYEALRIEINDLCGEFPESDLSPLKTSEKKD